MRENSFTFGIIQSTFYPLMLTITLVSSFLLIGYLETKYFIFIPGILLLFFVPVFILGEKYIPYREDWQMNKGDLGTDFLQTFVILPTASKLSEFLIPMVFYYPVLWTSQKADSTVLNEANGILINFAIALVCCEFLYYWFHRWCHKISVFWKFHAVHHGAQRVYWVNSGRFHIIEAVVSSMIYFLPLILLTATPEVIILVISFSSITGFMEHVNINFKAGFLNYIFNSAQLHRWHHSIIVHESNRNYGKSLVIWDLLFGTFYLPKEKEVQKVGIENANVPNGFARQFVYPFKREKK